MIQGGLLQLAAYGAEDLNLVANPEITFFKAIYKRHTNFSMESIDQVFIDKPLFNSINVITLNKKGDLISKIYLQVTLPSDPLLVNSYWTNRIGFNLINKIELYIGKKLIDRMYGLWMHIWTELTHTNDKKMLLDKMVGTTGLNGYSNGLNVSTPHTLTIPLLFFFYQHYGLVLPLIALSDTTDITLKFFFNKKDMCIQTGPMPDGDLSNVLLWIDYIYLEKQETLNLIQLPLEYLIEVTQHLERNLIYSGTKSILLPFSLACKELIWVMRYNTPNNDKFTDFTLNEKSMINTVQMKINSKNVFSGGPKPFNYFNYIVPYQFHKGSPDLGINALSFALTPENLEPSGILNISKNLRLTMEFNTIGNGTLHIFSFSYNTLLINKSKIDLVNKF